MKIRVNDLVGGSGHILWVKLLLIVGLALFMISKTPFWVDNISGGWGMCLNYLKGGELYGGQPFCNQAPLIYYYGLVWERVLGYPLLWIGFALTKIMVFSIIFYLICDFTSRLGQKNIFLNIILFLLIVYPLGANKPGALFSATLFLIGFNMQYHSKRSGHNILAGVSYALSLFFKYSAVYPLGLSIIIQFIRGLKSGIKGAVLDTIKLIIPILLLALTFYQLHPLFITYSVLGQILNPPASLFEAFILLFFSFNVHSITLILLIVLYAHLLYTCKLNEAERLYLLYPLICIPLVALSMTRAWAFYHGARYYGLHVFPFLIVSAYVLLKKKPRLFPLILVLVFIYPTFDESTPVASERGEYFSGEIRKFSDKVLSGLSVLPTSKKGLLFESGEMDINYIKKHGVNEFFSRYGWRVEGNENKFIYSGEEGYTGAEDPYWASRLRELTNVTLGLHKADEGLTGPEQKLKQEIMGGKYDVILFTAHSWIVVSRVFSHIPLSDFNYCRIFIPDFAQWGAGRSHAMIVYSNKSVCPTAALNLTAYYYEHFEEICDKSQKAADIVWKITAKNKILINKVCTSDAVFNREDTLKPKPLDFIITASLILLVNTLMKRPKRRKK